jgi:hypothetical protein
MPDIKASTILPGLRLAIGAGAWALPDQTGKVFGFALKDNHEAVYLGRLFGIRDIALAAGPRATSGASRRLWWQLGIVCDLSDAAAGVLALRGGGPKRASIMATLTALAAAGLGAAALAAEED